MVSDLDIARNSIMRPIGEIGELIGIKESDLINYGKYIAKVPYTLIDDFQGRPDACLILVTAMTPTSMGEGKTTNTIGLGQALSKLGKKTMIAIREPSLGPCMGVKGGAAGGGYSQVLPMEEINLHFTGDLHAVTTSHNLLSSIIDNHLHQKNYPEINPRNIVWRRTIDMNDRSLRNIIVGLEDRGQNGIMREDGFDITASSEIMAIFCLSNNIKELKEKIGKIIIGYDYLKKPVFAGDLGVQGAMAALLKNAMNPNLVQTIEGTPVFVHGGPFANIAHGCNTIIATKMAMKLSDYTVTEAGFGADLGAEKFFDIKCRLGNLKPKAAVLVITKRAFAVHGMENIIKHAENIGKFNVPVVISINKFQDDKPEDLKIIRAKCMEAGIDAVITDFREKGGEGGIEMAEKICDITDEKKSIKLKDFKYLYDTEKSIMEKIETIATEIYGADGVEYSGEAKTQIERIEVLGFGKLPVCMAKTQSSLSDNPKLAGRPRGFKLNVGSARVSAGAGFVVIQTGKIMTMPGLPKTPAAMNIDVDDNGNISGLF